MDGTSTTFFTKPELTPERREFYGRLRRRMFLKEVHLEDGEQPDKLADERRRLGQQRRQLLRTT